MKSSDIMPEVVSVTEMECNIMARCDCGYIIDTRIREDGEYDCPECKAEYVFRMINLKPILDKR